MFGVQGNVTLLTLDGFSAQTNRFGELGKVPLRGHPCPQRHSGTVSRTVAHCIGAPSPQSPEFHSKLQVKMELFASDSACSIASFPTSTHELGFNDRQDAAPYGQSFFQISMVLEHRTHISSAQLTKADEEAVGDEVEVRREDQDKINKFSRLHQRELKYEEELKLKNV